MRERMSQAIKTFQIEVHKDRRTQLLLSKFTSGEISELIPVFDPKCGYRYPVVESIVEQSEVEDFLKLLSEAHILKRNLYDKVIYCPRCGSANVSIHYRCPYCRSFDIMKRSLVEHVTCGYIDTEECFKVEGKFACPKCRKELTKLDVDYRKAGVWCTCNQCTKNFDIPVTAHFCRDCHETFDFEEVVCKDVYSYTLSYDAGKGYAFIAPIREFLQKRGFDVEGPGFLKGKSGASHMFELAAFRDKESMKVIVFDFAISSDDAVSDQAAIAMFAKVYDVAPDKAYLITVPKMNETGRKLAGLYKIRLIEAKDQNEAIKALDACLKE